MRFAPVIVIDLNYKPGSATPILQVLDMADQTGWLTRPIPGTDKWGYTNTTPNLRRRPQYLRASLKHYTPEGLEQNFRGVLIYADVPLPTKEQWDIYKVCFPLIWRAWGNHRWFGQPQADDIANMAPVIGPGIYRDGNIIPPFGL